MRNKTHLNLGWHEGEYISVNFNFWVKYSFNQDKTSKLFDISKTNMFHHTTVGLFHGCFHQVFSGSKVKLGHLSVHCKLIHLFHSFCLSC